LKVNLPLINLFMKNKTFLLLVMILFCGVMIVCRRSQDRDNKSVQVAKITDMLTPIDLQDVKLDGELGRRIDLTVNGNLLKIDIDNDFLAPFNGGKFPGFTDGSGLYIGIGKVLDGMVRLAKYSGNEALLARKNHVVESLINSQEKDGYIGILPPEKRTWGLFDLSEQGYIITALVSDYMFFGNKNSLTSACKLADYLINRWKGKPADWESTLPGIKEYFAEVGMDNGYLLLYSATGDKRYLDFASNELGTKNWDLNIVIGRHPPIDGHSYMYLSHCLAQLALYRIQPDEKLLIPTRRAVEFMTRKDGMTITGGVGHFECWTDDQDGKKDLGETCSTAYQIFVFNSLLRLEGDSRYGDLIERNLYNAAFGAQSPDGRRIRYYTPFEGNRVYFFSDSYCCPGNFRRLIGLLPQLVYYRSGNGLAINLYSASQATLEGIGGTTVTVRQETDYPNSGLVTLDIKPEVSAAFPLLLRIPKWCTQANVLVNGKTIDTRTKSGEFLKIDRTWQSGDRVTLDMPMPWRFVTGRKNQEGLAAVMRGPLVYTLNPDKESALTRIDLRRLVLLPGTAELVLNDTTFRPNGTACRIKADLDKAGKGALSLTLTEFPDPDGQWTYFQLQDPKASVDDELLVSQTNN
jgi:uncharacterized protein